VPVLPYATPAVVAAMSATICLTGAVASECGRSRTPQKCSLALDVRPRPVVHEID
jgi:hypothetical protein